MGKLIKRKNHNVFKAITSGRLTTVDIGSGRTNPEVILLWIFQGPVLTGGGAVSGWIA